MSASDLERDCVRLAVSEDRVLVSRWLIVVLIVAGVVVQNALSIWAARAFAIVLILFVLAVQRGWPRSYWVEQTAAGMSLRNRRPWHLVTRSRGSFVEAFSPDVPVRFDDEAPAWWRSDRALWIGGRRFAVYPDGRELARAIAATAPDSATPR